MSAIGVCRVFHNLDSIGRNEPAGKTTDGIPQSVLLNHRLAAECSKTMDFETPGIHFPKAFHYSPSIAAERLTDEPDCKNA
jgi:hypothetical protein